MSSARTIPILAPLTITPPHCGSVKLDHLDETYWLNRSLVAFDLHLFSRSLEDAKVALHCLHKADQAQSDLQSLLLLPSCTTPEAVAPVTPPVIHQDALQRLDHDRRCEMQRLSAKAHLRAAEARTRIDQLDEAAEDLNAAARLRPQCPEIQQARQSLRLVMHASAKERARWIRQQCPMRTIKEDDNNDDGLFSRDEFEAAVRGYVEGAY
ncbi:hypothetical protein ACQY0O_003501 [Thecaphora frezii]